MKAAPPRAARGRRDWRWPVLLLLIAGIAAGGWLVAGIPTDPKAKNTDALRAEIHQRFQQGVIMLHAKQYEHAMTAFHRVLQVDPAMPEAHVNMGFALIGLERHGAARDFFETAIALRKQQVNAYYGLALALDGVQDRAGAIGAMRTFLHLSPPDAPHALKAKAALQQWEAGRGRAPGGKTP